MICFVAKKELFSAKTAVKCFLCDIKMPLVLINGGKMFQVAEQNGQHLFTYNHDEAETRVVFHACLNDEICVVGVLMYLPRKTDQSKHWTKK